MIFLGLKKFWQALGSLNLTVALCFLLAADLAAAYFSLEKNLPIFSPLSEVGLTEWTRTYGLFNLKATAWFFIMMLLLALLGLNSFACTTDRVLPLLKKEARRPGWFMRLGPHIMHYAVLIILGGYLFSYLFAESLPGLALQPGATLRVPKLGSISFTGYDPVFYRGQRLDFFTDYILEPNFQLEMRDDSGRVSGGLLSFNRPVTFRGYKIYLRDFIPRHDKMGKSLRSIRVNLRRDRSSVIYLTGLGLFAAGLALYVYDRCKRKVKP